MTQISRDDKAIAAGLVAIAMSQGSGRDFIEKLDKEAERLFRMLDDSDSHREDYTGVLLAMGEVIRIVKSAIARGDYDSYV